MAGCEPLEKGLQHLALPADFHFFLPVLLDLALAEGAVDEPAELAGLELPGRTVDFSLARTLFDGPARFEFSFAASFPGQKKEYLAFDVGRNRTPALLAATLLWASASIEASAVAAHPCRKPTMRPSASPTVRSSTVHYPLPPLRGRHRRGPRGPNSTVPATRRAAPSLALTIGPASI